MRAVLRTAVLVLSVTALLDLSPPAFSLSSSAWAEAEPARETPVKRKHRPRRPRAAPTTVAPAGVNERNDPGCLYGRVLDGHSGRIRCLSPEELTPPGPYDTPTGLPADQPRPGATPPPSDPTKPSAQERETGSGEGSGSAWVSESPPPPPVDLVGSGPTSEPSEPSRAGLGPREPTEQRPREPTKQLRLREITQMTLEFEEGEVPHAEAALHRLAKKSFVSCFDDPDPLASASGAGAPRANSTVAAPRANGMAAPRANSITAQANASASGVGAPRANDMAAPLAHSTVAAPLAHSRTAALLQLRFLVRAPGRAEGVDVAKVQAVPPALVRCIVRALAGARVGAPSTDPVGVTLTMMLEPRLTGEALVR